MRSLAKALLGAAIVAVGAGAALPARPAQDPLAGIRADLLATRATLIASLERVKLHSDDPYDIVSRIDAALGSLDSQRAALDPQYAAAAALEATLDAAWVSQVTAGMCRDPSAIVPLGETCFTSTTDRTLQPLALYVPASFRAGQPAPLVVFLRGRGQTETDLIARADLRTLAESSGAIVAVPYARGRAHYDAAATQDVFDAVDTVERAFSIDPKRVYLAGFSMGGIGAFHVAGLAPKRFTAILCVVGTLEQDDRVAMRGFSGKGVYVVSAENDTQIPKEQGQATASYLRSIGISARYYEQPKGEHSLNSVLPAIKLAWHDMFAGVITPLDSGGASTAPPAFDAPAPLPSGQRPT